MASTRTGCERVPGIHQLDEARAVHVRVNLRRRNVGMAEQ
jgi:hypothetical protein